MGLIALSKLKPRKGRVLLSEPFLSEPYFKRSVIILTEHNEEGSIGFILNKPLDISLPSAIPDFPKFNGSLYLGGPVNKNKLFFIHTVGNKIKGSTEIINGLFWGGDINLLIKLIEANKVSASEFRLFAGYAGWGVKQLDNEFKAKSWIVAEADVEQIMDENTNRLWGNILKTMGKEYAMIANFPENPSLN